MDEGLTLLLGVKVALVPAWFLAFFALERLRPAASPASVVARSSGSRLLRNGSLWLMNSVLSPLLVVPLTVWAASAFLDWRAGWWSGWGGLLLGVLLLELVMSWWRWAN